MRFSAWLVVALVLLVVGTAASQSPPQPVAPGGDNAMAYRVWQFLDDDWRYLRQAIPKAREGGMNRIQLGQMIIMNIHTLNQSPEKLDLVRKIARLAHQHDLKVDLWTHELADVPSSLKKDGKVVINDDLWAWMRAKYAAAFRLLPETDGLVLTFAESQVKIYHDRVVSDLSPDARIAKLIDVMSDVCREHDKTLFVRTFVYQPSELEAMRRALASVADAVRGRGNVVVMTKCVPHDWSPFYPYNPLLGNTSGLPQIVEIDLGQEYTGLSKLLHCEVGYIHAVLNHCRKKGLVGAVTRVDRDRGNRALGTPNEVNLYAFDRLTMDPSATVDELWSEWAGKRYGEQAAPYVVDALKSTYDVTNLTLYPLEQWIENHSRLPNWKYACSHITFVTPAKWIPAPSQELARDELLRPDWITLRKINAEKDLARQLAVESLKILEGGRQHLKDEDYRQVRRYLEFGRDVVEVFRYQNLAFVATRRYLNRNRGIGIQRQSLKELRAEALSFVDQFDRSADLIEQRYGPEAYPGNPGLARRYAAEMRQLIESVPSREASASETIIMPTGNQDKIRRK
ncbi:MAG: hypothetical protein JW719_00350 [Pirellulales bacterium]|nr:hypothetical protein [Pirellulales bacterium]